MSKPDRFEAADLRCDACQSNTDFYGIMKTHKKGRWVKWDDYASLAAENANLKALQWETLKERNKAEAEVEWLRKADRLVCWNPTTQQWEVRHEALK